jgi:hypothetical protein
MKAQTITLSRTKVQQLVDFIEKFNLKNWVIAKNQGAYVGAYAGAQPEKQCLFFFKGCDPQKDADWYDTAHAKFGGDDFQDILRVEDLKNALANESMKSVKVKITSKSIDISVWK